MKNPASRKDPNRTRNNGGGKLSQRRSAGILLHPTSLPGPHGIGDLGEESYRFVDFLRDTRQTIWQVLPLGPTGYGDSPYASFSTFAGNPLLIDLDRLLDVGDLRADELRDIPAFPDRKVDFGWVQHWKVPLLEMAANRFLAEASSDRREDFERFCDSNKAWLDDYALFMAVKHRYDEKAAQAGFSGAMWNNYWDPDIALRKPSALERWRKDCREDVRRAKVLQYYFFAQWTALRGYANDRGVKLVGDIPIFVAPDSVDVWANRELFHLDANGRPKVVAGVPPDYFSPTGQLWGNPLYNWKAMEMRGFAWWISRIRATLNLVDIVRIDHFRGFEAYWEVPASEKTAERGRWVKAPGMKLFSVAKEEVGELPVMAEDLGVITAEVDRMREHFGFPGMRVLQFAFSANDGRLASDDPFLPHNHEYNSVIYTGTHDNDTTLGWYRSQSPEVQDIVRRYLARDDHDIVWDFIRLALSSVCRYAIIPMQDILALDTDARMNYPSTVGGNWTWRLQAKEIDDIVTGRLREMTELYDRAPLDDPAGEPKKRLGGGSRVVLESSD